MSTLTTMRQRISELTDILSTTEIAATLALTTKPDYKVTVRDEYDRKAKYVISAYGLTRANGGFVTVRFICPGQRDSVSFASFDQWAQNDLFRRIADQIAEKRYALLNGDK